MGTQRAQYRKAIQKTNASIETTQASFMENSNSQRCPYMEAQGHDIMSSNKTVDAQIKEESVDKNDP